MKNFILILLIFCSSINLMAQSPDLINYQAVAHDASGALLTLQPVTVTFGVYQGSASGTLVWEEEHATLTTNDYGLFYTKIGSGIGTGAGSLGTFSLINWGADTYYLKTQIDAGSGPQDLGTVQLVSVPYALESKNASGINNQPVNSAGAVAGNILIFNGVTGTWEVADPSSLYSAGSGIDITSGVISNTGDVDGTDDHIIAFNLNATSDSLYIQDGNGRYVVALSDINSLAVDADGDGWPANLDLDDSDVAVTFYDADNDPTNEYNISLDTASGNLVITDGGGTVTLPLSAIADGVDDADNDPTNEYNTGFGLNVGGDSLVLNDNGGSLAVSLASFSDGDWTVSGTDVYNNTGNIGVGIATPGMISGSDRYLTLSAGGLGLSSLELHGGSTLSSGIQSKIDFVARATSGSDFNVARIEVINSASLTNEAQMLFYTKNSGFIEERMRITETGFIGIGTATPAVELDVAGSATVGGNLLVQGITSAVGVFNADGDMNFGNGASDMIDFIGTIKDQTAMVFDGATTGGFTTSLEVTDPTANNTVTLQDGTGTLAFLSDISGGWGLNGNSGTVAGTNFLGTTDAQDLDIGINSVVYHRFTQQGQIEFLPSVGNSVLIGESAGENDDHDNNRNIYVGYLAGNQNVSGDLNVGVGASSLENATTANYNVGVGYGTLRSSTSGQNTAIGSRALFSHTSGIDNVSIGWNSLYNDQTGSGNTSVGTYAMQQNINGIYNVAIGLNALNNNVSGSHATAVGFNAMANANDASSFFVNKNIAVGYEALKGSTILSANTGSDNTAVGYQSMTNNTTGTGNVAIGNAALHSNTDGIYNTVIGWGAMENSVSASSNVAIGADVLQGSSGGSNTGVGAFSLDQNTTGVQNTAVGHLSLSGNVDGAYNSAVGKSSLLNNINGQNNVAMGYSTLSANTSGNLNVAVGSFSLSNNITGSNNSAFGHNALKESTGNQNVGIGYNAGDNNVNGSSNTFIGNNADAFLDNFTNATAIGANAQVGASNSLVLGNNANVGIGINAPSELLEINGGNVKITGGGTANPLVVRHPTDGYAVKVREADDGNDAIALFGYSTRGRILLNSNGTASVNIDADPSLSTYFNAGNVGVGTSAPSAKLDVEGTFQLKDGTEGDGKELVSDGSGNTSWKARKIAFHAGTNPVTDQTISAGTSTDIIMGEGINFFNDGGGYNTGISRFTPPVPGVYQMNCHLSYSGGASGAALQVQIYTPGGWVARSVGSVDGTGSGIVSLNAIVNSSVTFGPYWIRVFCSSNLTIKSYDSHFSGALIYEN
ncbi:hypothetical protein OAW23_00010 [Flavobacteriales bacterium]|nr:hypothetical protein [Flavobacteriales bacterium]